MLPSSSQGGLWGSQGTGAQAEWPLSSQGGSQGGSQPMLRRTTARGWKLATLRPPGSGCDGGAAGGGFNIPESLREPPIPAGHLFDEVRLLGTEPPPNSVCSRGMAA